MKYYQQNSKYGKTIKYPSKNHPKATISTSGCAICSLMQVCYNFGYTNIPSVKTITELAISSKCRLAEGTDILKLCKVFKNKKYINDFKKTDISTAIEMLKYNGIPFIVHCGQNNVFSNKGHFISVVGVESNYIVCIDPYYYQNKFKANSKRKSIKYDKKTHLCRVPQDIFKSDCDYAISTWVNGYQDINIKKNKIYTLNTHRNVYDSYDYKSRIQKDIKDLTIDGKQNATSIYNNEYAVLKVGTKVTIKEVKIVNSSVWCRIPSGWICLYSDGMSYAE